MGVNRTETNGAEKRRLYRVINEDGDYVQQLPETTAEQVAVEDSKKKFTATDVEGVLAEIDDKINSLDTGVTGVKGNKESSYRTGNVNLTPANIGAATDTDVNTIKGKIPDEASSTNKLADKAYVGTTIDGKLTSYATKEELQTGLAGKPKTMVFENYETFVNTGNTLTITDLKAGDNVYIKTLNVPDLWVSATPSGTKVTYTYTSDDAIVEALKVGTIQVGYFTFSALETNKVDYDYNELENKPKLNTNNTASQAASASEELKGTINLHKIAKTGKFSDLLDSPVIETAITDCNQLTTPAIYKLTGLLTNGPALNYTSDTRLWLIVQKYYIDGAEKISQVVITYDYLYRRELIGQTGQTIWTTWSNLYIDQIAKLSDIPVIPNITVETSGSGIVSDVAVDSTNKHKLKVTKKALTNSDLPNSGATAGTYTAVEVNAKGVVTKGGTSIEFGTADNNTPSAKLMVGGLFFELQT